MFVDPTLPYLIPPCPAGGEPTGVNPGSEVLRPSAVVAKVGAGTTSRKASLACIGACVINVLPAGGDRHPNQTLQELVASTLRQMVDAEASRVASGKATCEVGMSGAALVAVAIAPTSEKKPVVLSSTYDERSPTPPRADQEEVRLYLFRLVVSTPNRSHKTTVAVDIGVGRDAKDCTLFFPGFTQLSRRHCTIHLRFSIEAVKLAPIVGAKRTRDDKPPLWSWAVTSATAGVVDHGSLNGTSVLVNTDGDPTLHAVDPQCPVAVTLPPVSLSTSTPLQGLFATLAPLCPVNFGVYHLATSAACKNSTRKTDFEEDEVPQNVAVSNSIKKRVVSNQSRSPHIPMSMQSTAGPTVSDDDMLSGMTTSDSKFVTKGVHTDHPFDRRLEDEPHEGVLSPDRPITVLTINCCLSEAEVGVLSSLGVIVVTPSRMQHALATTTTSSSSDILLECDPEQALYRSVDYIVVAPPLYPSVRLLASIPHARAVVSHRWLLGMLSQHSMMGGSSQGRLDVARLPTMSFDALDEAHSQAMEDQYRFSLRHLLYDFGPQERRQLFVPLKFYIHPSCALPANHKNMGRTSDAPLQGDSTLRIMDAPLHRLRSIIVSSGGIVVSDPLEEDANVLIFPSIPRTLPLYGWGHKQDEDETDDAEGSDGSDSLDTDTQFRRRRRSERDPSAAAKVARQKKLQKERDLLGLPCSGSIPQLFRAMLVSSIKRIVSSGRASPLRKRKGANAFHLWCLNRCCISEGRSVPKPPAPSRGIQHRNQANQEFVQHARAASGLLTPMTMDHSSFSIVNPNNVGKDDAARCNVLGVCVPEDIVRAVLRQQRQLPLRTFGVGNA